MWKGTISFGLVNIPVRMVPAVKEKDVRFHMLHRKDNSRLERKMVCPVDHKEVAADDIVKGYEISPGQHVIIEKEELDALAPKASRTIEIGYFADVKEIDPIYFSQPYYLVPEEGAAKSYRLFVDAMEKSKKAGVAAFVMRNKEYLAVIRADQKALVLQTLHFDDEVIPATKYQDASHQPQVSEREMKTALQLIESLSDHFEPEKVKDEYREKVIDLVEKKSEGREVVLQPEEPSETPKVKDLLAALEASLSEAKKKKGRGPVLHLARESRLAHAHPN